MITTSDQVVLQEKYISTLHNFFYSCAERDPILQQNGINVCFEPKQIKWYVEMPIIGKWILVFL